MRVTLPKQGDSALGSWTHRNRGQRDSGAPGPRKRNKGSTSHNYNPSVWIFKQLNLFNDNNLFVTFAALRDPRFKKHWLKPRRLSFENISSLNRHNNVRADSLLIDKRFLIIINQAAEKRLVICGYT